MNVEILHYAVEPANYEPLTVKHSLDECMIANQSFRQLCQAELDEARFHQTADRDALTLYVHGNAWLCARDLKKIKRLDRATLIRNSKDEVLAWTAAGTIVSDTADTIVAADSLLLEYSWDLLHLNEILLNRLRDDCIEGDISPNATVDGHIHVGRGSRILPGTYIEGNVIIGEKCKIGPNAYLRGPLSIGNKCHIGNAVEVKASIVMDGSSIGHLSYVGDSILGRQTNFGGGTITANLRHDGKNQTTLIGNKLVDTGRRKLGAIVGDGVHTGINTSIYPGRKLWPTTATRPGEVLDQDRRT